MKEHVDTIIIHSYNVFIFEENEIYITYNSSYHSIYSSIHASM